MTGNCRNSQVCLRSKLYFYLSHPDEMQRIVENAVDFFHNHWTWNHRAKTLIDLIKGIKQ